jgi:hypothetical protein
LSLRDSLRARAQGRCEYCRIHEGFTTLRFQIDHIIAQKHQGANDLSNLAWSCANCNAYKGTDLSGIDPVTGELHRLFNPRADNWSDHFGWQGAVILGLTPIGRVTISVLQFNRAEHITLREELIAQGVFH